MKALVEIKTNTKIEDIAVVNAGTEKYNSIVNDILQSREFTVTDVQVFEKHPENDKEYPSMEVDEATYITTVVDLNQEEMEHFNLHENEIIGKIMEALNNRDLDILAASEFGTESFVYFNQE